MELKPCPFCGGEPFVDAVDRLIRIGCIDCGYSRGFHGLVQSEINTGIPVMYHGGVMSDHEWFDGKAQERATEAWNKRADDG